MKVLKELTNNAQHTYGKTATKTKYNANANHKYCSKRYITPRDKEIITRLLEKENTHDATAPFNDS